MPSVTVRISTPTRDILRQLADQAGEPMQVILDKAIEAYRRQHFLEKANEAFQTLRSDPEAWENEQSERAAWDSTLADGLEDD